LHRGELALETAPALRHRLHDALAEGTTQLVIDLGGLTFIDSTGITVLVDSLKQAQRLGGSMVLRHPTPATRRVLEITGLLGLFGLD
ncbi:MAG: STAS domain-containing protein, partial [Acidimicrobiales bacterium]